MSSKEIRKGELRAIRNCCINFPLFKSFNKESQKKLILAIESSILDASVDKARDRNIPVYWNSDNFIEQYSNIGYHVKINLDVNSSILINKDDKTRYYLISRLCNSVIVNYLQELHNKYVSWKEEKKILTSNIVPEKSFLNLPPGIFGKILEFVPVINPKNVGYMNPLEFNPYINQVYIDELITREKQTIKIKFSKMYTCSQCGNKKTQMRELQTRSGDEGGTLFIKCIVCQHTWRQY
jgi:DNA-directed RNA polymerase subunit M/transcription elongation factor TFIIS